MYADFEAWSMDFLRALAERPKIFKILLRWIFGKYAYREFIGMIESHNKHLVNINCGYDLKEIDYHKDKVPLLWWNIRRTEGQWENLNGQ